MHLLWVGEHITLKIIHIQIPIDVVEPWWDIGVAYAGSPPQRPSPRISLQWKNSSGTTIFQHQGLSRNGEYQSKIGALISLAKNMKFQGILRNFEFPNSPKKAEQLGPPPAMHADAAVHRQDLVAACDEAESLGILRRLVATVGTGNWSLIQWPSPFQVFGQLRTKGSLPLRSNSEVTQKCHGAQGPW